MAFVIHLYCSCTDGSVKINCRCVLHNNCRYLGQEGTIHASSGKVTISDTQITGNHGGGQ